MGIAQHLAELDNRVLGKPKPRTAADYRKTFFGGLVMLAIWLVIVGLAGTWDALAPAAGLFALTIVYGARWYWSRDRAGRL